MLPTHLADDDVFRERFRAEAVTIAKLRHPNILAVYDYGNVSVLHADVRGYSTLAESLEPEQVMRLLLAGATEALEQLREVTLSALLRAG